MQQEQIELLVRPISYWAVARCHQQTKAQICGRQPNSSKPCIGAEVDRIDQATSPFIALNNRRALQRPNDAVLGSRRLRFNVRQEQGYDGLSYQTCRIPPHALRLSRPRRNSWNILLPNHLVQAIYILRINLLQQIKLYLQLR